MCYLYILVVVALSTLSHLPSISAGSCEETETAYVKLDLAKQSISDAKFLYPKCQDEKHYSNCSKKDKSLAHLNAAFDLISEAKKMCHSCPETKVIIPQDRFLDCSEIYAMGFTESGVYKIWPRSYGVVSNKPFDVYCDMDTDGGGWTVIQRRGNFTNQTNFDQDWETYKNGFGDVKQDFWLGNDKMFYLTNQGIYSVRFDLVENKGEYRYAQYDVFSIGNEKSNYLLTIKNHSGNATDDMRYHDGFKFSTKDRKNDDKKDLTCAITYGSAFWYYSNGCSRVSLNGVYRPGVRDWKSIWWMGWKEMECLFSVEVKVRLRSSTIA